MSDRPDGGTIAGILTGALLGVTVAMALSPVKAGTKPSNPLFARGRSILDAAADGLGSAPAGHPTAGSDSSSPPGA